MSALEELMHAALAAPENRRDHALAVLRGQLAAIDPAQATPVYEPYLTLREVALRLGVSAASLWRWQVPGHSLGGRRRFRISEVEAYLRSEAFERRAAALRSHRRHRAAAMENAQPPRSIPIDAHGGVTSAKPRPKVPPECAPVRQIEPQ
jgi:predicted DNA-binding transcriptional regulator AlpA